MAQDRSPDTSLIETLKTAADQLRRLSIMMTTEAGSGHPTTCLSAADLVATLFFHVLRVDVQDPGNPANDRLVLSKGHGAPLLYAAWAEAGAFPDDHLMTLRRFDSDLEGHPTPRFSWAEVGTGSLGQGLSIGLGMAAAGKLDDLDFRVYVLMGDGETAEGAVWEAAALAAHRGLDNLIGIVDVNRLGQSQPTMVQHDLATYHRRFSAFGWHPINIDGHDIGQILTAFEQAHQVTGQPVVILARTLKGKGVSFLEDQEGWHGKPLAKGEQTEKALQELSRPPGKPRPWSMNRVRSESVRHDRQCAGAGRLAPPEYVLGQQVATREAFGTALAKLGAVDPRVVALDGDTKNSTYSETFLSHYPERFFECFIAEQNMVSMAVGLQTRGKIPFASTFACFLTRAFDQIRMAGISRANVKFCGSHAGVSIGEDGPSQMGLEDLAMMRTIPESIVLYPCDAVSSERLVELAARHRGLAYIRTSRPKTPVIYPNEDTFTIGGCKILRSGPADQVTIVSAGVTLHEALSAYDELQREGISVRVIDLYSVKPVDQAALLKAASETNRLLLTVEDHYPEGGLGDAVSDAVGSAGVRVMKLAVRELPRSGKAHELLDAYGISARAIAAEVRRLLR